MDKGNARTALCVILLGAAVLAATPSLAQSYCDPRVNAACYQKWCTSQGGKPVYRGNWGCDMSSAGGSAGGSSAAQLGQQIGGVLGALIREGLFGNPQQDAARRAAMEEQRRLQEQENQRRAEEIARQDEARYQRLRASLLGFNPPPRLSPIGTPSSGGLQLILGEEAERSSNPALAELTRAAAWSTLAAGAKSPEDAVELAEAAFQSLIGGKVDLPAPPPDVKGVPVHPLLPEVQPLKKEYLELSSQLPNAMKPVVQAEQRLAQFMRVERQAREFELTQYQGVRKDQAREAVKQATQLREQVEAEVKRARADFEQRQYAVNGVDQGLRALLSSLSSAPRTPDAYFYLGFEDGSRCFSQNAGPRCDKAGAPKDAFETCVASYKLGYTAGEKMRRGMLEDAYQSGSRDGPAGVYAITDRRAEGPCRYDFVMAYNRGYFRTGAAAAP